MIRRTMSRREWEQINHFFYPIEPHQRPIFDPENYTPIATPFEKLEGITDHLRKL